MIILGLGLILLWVVGVSSQGADGWLVWFDGIIGLCAIVTGLAMSADSTSTTRSGAPLLTAIGLLALAIIGFAVVATLWLTWWTFGFACAFMLTGFLAMSLPKRPHHAATA